MIYCRNKGVGRRLCCTSKVCYIVVFEVLYKALYYEQVFAFNEPEDIVLLY